MTGRDKTGTGAKFSGVRPPMRYGIAMALTEAQTGLRASVFDELRSFGIFSGACFAFILSCCARFRRFFEGALKP